MCECVVMCVVSVRDRQLQPHVFCSTSPPHRVLSEDTRKMGCVCVVWSCVDPVDATVAVDTTAPLRLSPHRFSALTLANGSVGTTVDLSFPPYLPCSVHRHSQTGVCLPPSR